MSEIRATNFRMMGFSLPSLGLNMLVTAVFVFLPPLYAENLGLGAVVGGIFFAAKLVDITAAPLWGLLMDGYKTRWGRRKPWLALSTPILMLAIFMVYNPPENAGGLHLFIWLATLYVGWSAWTISHTSWALELSRDYDRRSRITGLLQAMTMIGGILIGGGWAIMEWIATPTLEQTASAIGWFMIIVLPITVIICLLSMPERVTSNRPHLGFKKGASLVFTNMPLLRLLIANFMISFSTYFVQAHVVFFVSFTLNLQDKAGFILIFLLVGGLVGLPIWVRLSERWTKHSCMQIAVATGAVTSLLLLALPSNAVILTTVTFLLVGLNSSANEFLPRAMMADVCDHDHIQSGSERMGLYYSLLQASSKLASGIGIFLVMSVLGAFAFIPELGADNTDTVLQRLRYLIVILPMIAYVIVIGLMWRYPISREYQTEMRGIIEERERLALGSSTIDS
jgi:GPH family glycoside/pentoside/hexuronide:cation symporter